GLFLFHVKSLSHNANTAFARWRQNLRKLEIEEMNSAATTPFYAVCIFGLTEMLSPLKPQEITLLNRPYPFAVPRVYSGMTGLHMAIQNNRVATVRALLDKGADVAEYNSRGETPLHIASNLGHYKIIHLLIEKGADPNIMSRVQ